MMTSTILSLAGVGSGTLDDEFGAIHAPWTPRVVAAANGQFVKIAKADGELVWHAHAQEDEFFLCLAGEFTLAFRDGSSVTLKPGDFHVVPRGVEHLPSALPGTRVLFVEPAATTHLGDVESERAVSIEDQSAHLAR